MSPRTMFLVFVVFIAVVVTLLLKLMDIPFRPSYGSAVLVIALAVVIYAVLTRIATKLRQKKCSG